MKGEMILLVVLNFTKMFEISTNPNILLNTN